MSGVRVAARKHFFPMSALVRRLAKKRLPALSGAMEASGRSPGSARRLIGGSCQSGNR